MNGMVIWHVHSFMECLLLTLQAALLGYAVSNCLIFINKVVASFIIGFTSFGLLFHLIVSAATLSYNCPFQIPASLTLCFLIHFDNEHKNHLKRTRKWLGGIFYRKKWQRPTPGGVSGLGRFGTFDGRDPGSHIGFLMTNPDQPSPLFNKATDWHGYDSNCIAWISEMLVDPDVITAITRFISEVVWYAGIRTTPLEQLYDTVLECFDRSSGCPVVIPKVRNKAYLSAKALLHLAVQSKCIGDESDKAAFKSISNRHPIMESKHYEGDSDLEVILGIIDRVFDDFGPMHWQNFSFTVTYHQDDKPFELRKAALFFLPLIGDRWFNTPHPIMEPDQMRSLCVDWASAVDGIEHTYDVQKATLAVLFGMINSPHWRPHIVTEKWKLLEYFTSVPDDSQPLRRCIDNPELMDAIKNVRKSGCYGPLAGNLVVEVQWS
jgi:hypothetical protein